MTRHPVRLAGPAAALLLVAGGHRWLAHGPQSFRARFERGAAALTAADAGAGTPLVREADLGHLPTPVATYLRRSGAVGRPLPTGFCATFHGRIRAGIDQPWMTFTAEQASRYPAPGDPAGDAPTRLFHLRATRAGLPVDVLHELVDGHATMRVRLLSLVPLVDASGPELDRAETVTLFNDLCVFAPGALVHAPVGWEQLDPHRVRGTYTQAGISTAAELVFDADGDLRDFVADGRGAASADGRSFEQMPWSTPLLDHGDFDGRRLCRRGDAVWHTPEGPVTYLELSVDSVATHP
ncbi:DUF6544 family protein [Cellulomonas hominis]